MLLKIYIQDRIGQDRIGFILLQGIRSFQKNPERSGISGCSQKKRCKVYQCKHNSFYNKIVGHFGLFRAVLGHFLDNFVAFLSIFDNFWPIWVMYENLIWMVFVYLGGIWLVFVCYLGGICVWVVWLRSVWLQRSASIPLFYYYLHTKVTLVK